jgi:hypothetical protein
MLDKLLVYTVILVIVAVFVGACFAAALLYRRLFGLPLWMKFLERTGYRRKADPSAPLEAQARAVMAEIFRPEGVVRGPWIRDVEGLTLTYNSWMYREDEANVTQESWQLELPFDAGFQVQLLERRLAQPGMLQKLTSEALGRSRRWGERLPHEIRTGDSNFDQRFLVLSDEAATVPPFLLDPALRPQPAHSTPARDRSSRRRSA